METLIVEGDQAVVELHSMAKARNGMRFDNRYCWIVPFKVTTDQGLEGRGEAFGFRAVRSAKLAIDE